MGSIFALQVANSGYTTLSLDSQYSKRPIVPL